MEFGPQVLLTGSGGKSYPIILSAWAIRFDAVERHYGSAQVDP